MLGSGRRLGAEAQAGWIPSARALSGRGRSAGCGRRGASRITIRVLSRRVTGGAWPHPLASSLSYRTASHTAGGLTRNTFLKACVRE